MQNQFLFEVIASHFVCLLRCSVIVHYISARTMSLYVIGITCILCQSVIDALNVPYLSIVSVKMLTALGQRDGTSHLQHSRGLQI